MRAFAMSLFPLVFLCASASLAQERSLTATRATTTSGATYITHVTVIDTENGKEAQDRTVVISRDRISEVRDSKGVKPPAGSNVVDGTGKYLIPGLWDMHVHAFTFSEGSTGSVTTMPPEMYFRLAIANGVTGFREMGGPETPDDLASLRHGGSGGGTLVPKLFAAGPVLDGPKPTWPQHSLSVKTEQEGREAVRKIKSGGFDFVKVYNGVPREAYSGIAQEAREQGISFVGHVPLSISALQASTAGQKSIEHFSRVLTACSSQENEIDAMFQDAITKGQPIFPLIAKAQQIQLSTYDTSKAKALFETFAKNQTWQVPTFTQQRAFAYLDDKEFRTDSRLVYIPAEVQQSWDPQTDFRMKWLTPDDWKRAKQIYEKSFEIAREMHRQGVRFLAGTDLVNAYIFSGFSLHDELGLLTKAGLSNLEALQAATWNAALFLNASDKYGSVAPGKIADLVLLDADPLKDIHNTTRISEVFLSGKEFDRTALDQVLRNAEAATKPALATTQHLPPAPGALRLYVFDCGKLTIRDPGPFGFTKEELATTDISDPCFLVAHPKGTLMWEVGVLPDSVFTTADSVTRGAATVTKPLKARLAEVGYVPAEITYLAFSHCHGDHTANANDFVAATWLVRQEEREAMFAQPPSECWAPESYSALRDSKTMILTRDDYDVFGDGTVILKFAPGHTPGHQVLFLNLRKTGPVLLSGDLYHYHEERTHHRVPTREFNGEQTIASRAEIETLLKKTGAQLWIQHDFTANAKLKRAPAFYE